MTSALYAAVAVPGLTLAGLALVGATAATRWLRIWRRP